MSQSETHLSKLNQFFLQYPAKSLDKGQSVLEVDSKLTHILFLTEGFVRQYAVSKEGQEFTLNIFEPFSFFPLNLAFHREVNPYYFEAFSPIKFNRAPIADVEKFIQENPDVLFDLIQRITSGLNGMLYRMESLMFGSAKEKVAAALFLCGARFGAAHAPIDQCPHDEVPVDQVKLVDFKLTHQQIAFMTGLTRETVSVEMGKLKKEGLVDYQQQRICLLKPQELKELSSLPFYQ
jgi:CRP-like cAMP-binding protein